MLRIDEDAFHRANLNALWRIEMTYALGAETVVDLIDLFAGRYCLIGTFGFTDIAVYTFVGDH
jgi:hypothetical protein